MELLLQNSSLSWLCLVALFAFSELFFMRYRMIWLSVGATAGLITSLCSGDLWLQVTIAVIVSAALLWFSRSWVKLVRCDDVIQEMISEEREDKTIEDFQKSSISPIFTAENDPSIIVLPQPEDPEEFDVETSCPIPLFEF